VIVIVAGVSGSGKSTVGEELAGKLGWAFIDGDSLHPRENIAKMSAGTPLTDADRMPWLDAIGGWLDARLTAAEPGVLACSALKRSYRDLLMASRPAVSMAFLRICREIAAQRLAERHGHFFDPHLLASQFADLEPPGPDEKAVWVVPVAGTPAEVAGDIVSRLSLPDPDPDPDPRPGPLSESGRT